MKNTRDKDESQVHFLKRFYKRFIQIRGTPREIALGFALGVFVSMSPTMGFQIAIAVFLAAFLKWNKIAASLAVFITNPFTAPFIYSLTYFVGAKILKLEKIFEIPEELSIGVALAMLEKTPKIFAAMTIGGIVVGIPLTIVSFILVYFIASMSQRKIR
ncbi:DUF2062 domain-containing protein [bacterium]|nr:DUF2062 domain-containing protein [bacterium]